MIMSLHCQNLFVVTIYKINYTLTYFCFICSSQSTYIIIYVREKNRNVLYYNKYNHFLQQNKNNDHYNYQVGNKWKQIRQNNWKHQSGSDVKIM